MEPSTTFESCVIPECPNNCEENTVTSFPFPKVAALCLKWIQRVPPGNWSLNSKTAICLRHFLVSDLTLDDAGVWKLSADAVPQVRLSPSATDGALGLSENKILGIPEPEEKQEESKNGDHSPQNGEIAMGAMGDSDSEVEIIEPVVHTYEVYDSEEEKEFPKPEKPNEPDLLLEVTEEAFGDPLPLVKAELVDVNDKDQLIQKELPKICYKKKAVLGCCVPTCGSVSGHPAGVGFHHFPRYGETKVAVKSTGVRMTIHDLHSMWKSILDLSDVTSSSFVCTRHFTPQDYTNDVLNRTAVPTQFLPNRKSVIIRASKQPMVISSSLLTNPPQSLTGQTASTDENRQINSTKCSIRSCRVDIKNDPSLALFTLPTTCMRATEWLYLAGEAYHLDKGMLCARMNFRICSKHFADEMFLDKGKTTLIENAKPKLAGPIPFKKCVVENCGYYYDKKRMSLIGIDFYQFPTKESRRKEWIQAVFPNGGQMEEDPVICSNHFKPQDFTNRRLYKNSTGKYLSHLVPLDLLSIAVPSLHLQKETRAWTDPNINEVNVSSTTNLENIPHPRMRKRRATSTGKDAKVPVSAKKSNKLAQPLQVTDSSNRDETTDSTPSDKDNKIAIIEPSFRSMFMGPVSAKKSIKLAQPLEVIDSSNSDETTDSTSSDKDNRVAIIEPSFRSMFMGSPPEQKKRGPKKRAPVCTRQLRKRKQRVNYAEMLDSRLGAASSSGSEAEIDDKLQSDASFFSSLLVPLERLHSSRRKEFVDYLVKIVGGINDGWD